MPGWNPSFRVHGQVCHLIGSLMPLPGEVPKFLQVYFIDNQVEETSMRMSIAGGLKRNIVQELSTMFHNKNQYVQQLKTAHEHLLSNNTNEGWKLLFMKRSAQGQSMHVVSIDHQVMKLGSSCRMNQLTIEISYYTTVMATWTEFRNCTVHMMLCSTHFCFLMVLKGITST